MSTAVSAAKDIVKQINVSEEALDSTKEVLDLLTELSKTKAQLFEKEINEDLDSSENQLLPISKRVNSRTETHVYHGEQSDIVSAVSSSVQNLIGKISEENSTWDGITNAAISLASNGLSEVITAFLGSKSGSEDVIKYYFIYVKDYSLFRVDLRGWKRDIETHSITSIIQNVSAFSYVQSVVDISKCDYYSFQSYFAETAKYLIREDNNYKGKKFIEVVKEIYAELGGKLPDSSKKSFSQVTAMSAPSDPELNASTFLNRVL